MLLQTIGRRLDSPEFVFASTWHVEAMARLAFACNHGLELVFLQSPGGCGKTTALQRFRSTPLARPLCLISLNLDGLAEHELIDTLADQLTQGRAHARVKQWQRITERLVELGLEHCPLVILADNVDRAQPDSLDLLRRLWDSAPGTQTTMVFAGSELPSYRDTDWWLDRVDLRIELAPWSIDEIAGLFAAAGDAESRVISVGAIAQLHQATSGVPRHVRRLARLALVAAEAVGHTEVSEDLILAVSEELCATSL